MQDRTSRRRRGDARSRIKAVALRLFSDGGFEGVSTRDIIGAAGYRNATLINYYFESKERLIAELIGDVVRALEADRHARLNALEERGGPRNIRDILEIIASPLPAMSIDTDAGEVSAHRVRFFNMVLVNHRDVLLEAMGAETDSGTRRCLVHIRRMMPPLPGPLARERLYFMVLFMTAALSSREAASEQPLPWRFLWEESSAWSCMLDSAEAMLMHAPSAETENSLAERQMSRSFPPSP
jgi:AcrR family transcriptional regulator